MPANPAALSGLKAMRELPSYAGEALQGAWIDLVMSLTDDEARGAGKALRALVGPEQSLWHLPRNHTHADILALLDRAIAAAEGES